MTIAITIELTFVPVGPVNSKPPTFFKASYELCSFNTFSTSIPFSLSFLYVVPSTIPPAASVGPSVPSVSKATIRASRSEIFLVALSAISWLGPPFPPLPSIVTVVSPPNTRTTGGSNGLPLSAISWTIDPMNNPASLASPSKVVVIIYALNPSL
ncbi:154aa long hypothetical protein [Pyrococcus horikoshii OT3]|uniref:Uncharacterized protein n=1 Tax=Pyrococcus horikoshii (strain ATCC 700860 / DSM 12428 / JCM 9974 / NBRC 100139 / OT-3) TaxID=70601 RepID=O58232_PYRHO|nr:154aa long hypothetical protein [Pyrococcus horikoshii OT3]